MAVKQRCPAYRGCYDCIAEPVYNGHPWDHTEWRLVVQDFGTYPTGWHIEGDLPSQVAVSTGSTVI